MIAVKVMLLACAVLSAAAVPSPQAAVLATRADTASCATRPGTFVVDPPTLACLGFAWTIAGDTNRNATATVEYRPAAEDAWRAALPLLRIGGEHVGRSSDWLDHEVPHMLAGSIFDLSPDTEYHVRISLRDPDGVAGCAATTVTVRTRAESKPATGGRVYHVYPPGHPVRWPNNEFNNLYKAYYGGFGNLGDFNMVWERTVQPGDTILVHAGTYQANLRHYTDPAGLVPDGTYWLTAKGTPDKPITIKAAGDGEVVFDGAGAEVLFNVMAADHHIFEGLTLRNCGYAVFAGQQRVTGCKGLIVRRCRFEDVRDGIFTLFNGSEDFLVEDCVFEGRNARDVLTGWGAASNGFLKSNTAITLQGTGHVVRRNRIAYFWQGIHMGTAFQGFDRGGIACDFYGNDLDMLIDDGIEIDGCVRNVRVLRNRVMNTGSAFSAQPVYGGPAYFIRNVAVNARTSSLKFHEAHPAGLLVYHNTVIGASLLARGLYANLHMRNNLYLPLPAAAGTGARSVVAFPEPVATTTSDYNGYGPGTMFKSTPLNPYAPIMDKSPDPYWPLKKYPDRQAEKTYASLAALRAATGLEQHGIAVSFAVFAHMKPEPLPPSGILKAMDVTLNPAGTAVNAGMPLPNVNDGFAGTAPDIGAYELGQPLPHYGQAAGAMIDGAARDVDEINRL